jgi:hypothetical protein
MLRGMRPPCASKSCNGLFFRRGVEDIHGRVVLEAILNRLIIALSWLLPGGY